MWHDELVHNEHGETSGSVAPQTLNALKPKPQQRMNASHSPEFIQVLRRSCIIISLVSFTFVREPTPGDSIEDSSALQPTKVPLLQEVFIL
jgi:hypothetical protein